MLPRTFYLTPQEDAELRQAAADAGKSEDELIRELLAEGIRRERSLFPALQQTVRPAVAAGDFAWAWLPGHTVKKTVGLSPEEDAEIRRISFAQGAITGNRFCFFVMDALRLRRSQKRR